VSTICGDFALIKEGNTQSTQDKVDIYIYTDWEGSCKDAGHNYGKGKKGRLLEIDTLTN